MEQEWKPGLVQQESYLPDMKEPQQMGPQSMNRSNIICHPCILYLDILRVLNYLMWEEFENNALPAKFWKEQVVASRISKPNGPENRCPHPPNSYHVILSIKKS